MVRLLWFIVFLWSQAAAEPKLPRSPFHPEISTFIDSSQNLGAEDIFLKAEFTKGPSVIGFEDSVFWVRFEIHNGEPHTIPLIFEDQWTLTDRLEVYQAVGSQLELKAVLGHLSEPGDPSLRSFHRYPYTKLQIDPGTQIFYAKYQSSDVVGSRIALWHPADFERYKLSSTLIYGFLLGAILIMSLYNFFLYLSLKNIAYLYYAAYSFFFFAFQFCFAGFLAQASGVYRWTIDEATVQFASLAMVGIILFSRTFLHLRDYSPRLYRCGDGLIVLSLAAFLLSFFDFQSSTQALISCNLALATYVLVIGTVALLQGIPEAKFYMFAWIFFVIGDYFSVAYYLGYAAPSVLSLWGMVVGSTIEVVLLSFGLARSVHRMRQEVQEAKDALNLELAQNLRLAKEQEETRTLFFQNTSHELRTPLNGIIGFLELVLADRYGTIDPEAKLKLVKAHSLAEGLKHQVNTILDLAKSRQGKLELTASEFSLSELKTTLDMLAEGLLLNSPLRSYSSELVGEDIRFIGDYDKIQTILRNLLGNAFKFCDSDRHNHVRLTIGIIDQHLSLRVEDSGIGISEDKQSRVFDEFFQVEQDARRRFEGSGLGLSMVQNLVRMMRANIRLTSKPGVGSIFEIRIPPSPITAVVGSATAHRMMAISPHTPDQSTRQHQQKQLSPGLRGADAFSILVIDDSPTNCELMSDILRGEGYNLRICLSGKTALELMQEFKPDLILLDMMMPEMSGEDVLTSLRSDPSFHDIPVILVTARASDEDRIHGLALGADDYLPKPIFAGELCLRVKNILQRLQLLREIERSHRDEKLIQLGEMFHDLSHEIKNILQGSQSILPLAPQDALLGLLPCSFHQDLQKQLGQALVESGKEFRSRSHRLESLLPISDDDPMKQLKRRVRSHLFDTQLSENELVKIWNAFQLVDETEWTYLEAQMRVYVQHQILIHSLSRAQELTHSLLNYTRTHDHSAVANLNLCWQDTLGLLKGRYRRESIRWQVELPARDLRIQPAALTQVFVNFVLNAIDAIRLLPAEQKWIRLTSRIANNKLEILCANGGPPIAPQIQERLFERGFSTKGKDGSGIGLYVSRRILREAGGDLLYDSSSDCPCFILRVPLLMATEDPSTEPPLLEAAPYSVA